MEVSPSVIDTQDIIACYFLHPLQACVAQAVIKHRSPSIPAVLHAGFMLKFYFALFHPTAPSSTYKRTVEAELGLIALTVTCTD